MTITRVAALYDIHGNLPALEAVLEDPRLAAVDLIVCGGDLVAGPLPAECQDRLEALEDRVRFLSGNGDRETIAPEGEHMAAARWAAERLGERRLARIAGWPATVALEITGLGGVLFCHGTPRSDTRLVTAATPDDVVEAELAEMTEEVVVCGHTHVQFDRRLPGGRRLINAGSVGMPYEASPAARWALLGPDVELVATEYEHTKGFAFLERAGFPMFEDWFAPVARGEITADEATQRFEERRRTEAGET